MKPGILNYKHYFQYSITDVAILIDARLMEKELEEIEKYQNLII